MLAVAVHAIWRVSFLEMVEDVCPAVLVDQFESMMLVVSIQAVDPRTCTTFEMLIKDQEKRMLLHS
jgi:hypothetical protein